MKKFINLIKELMEKKFYGELTIKFEAGKIVIVRKVENIKLAPEGLNQGVDYE